MKAASLQKLGKGDISGILAQAMTNAVSITAPTFFSTSTDLFQDTIAAIQFGFQGVAVAPCAIPITPLGVGIFPQVWRPNLPALLCTGCVLQIPGPELMFSSSAGR